MSSNEEETMLNRCNAYIRRIIHQEVRLRWPNKIRVEGKVDGTTQGLMVYKMGTKEEEKKKEEERREKEKEELKEAVGLSVLLRKIADSVCTCIAIIINFFFYWSNKINFYFSE